MSAGTSIEWAQSSWNPIRGTKGRHTCQRISPGCKNCYAATMNRRFGGSDYVAGADEPRLDEKALTLPLRWRKPQRIFVCSMTDLFWERIPDQWIDRVFAVMAQAKRHTFQILTKRSDRMLAYGAAMAALSPKERTRRLVASMYRGRPAERLVSGDVSDEHVGDLAWPLPNVWLGVSVEDQATADERIPLLLQTPAAVRWVSYEPALGPVDFRPWLGGPDEDRDCARCGLPWDEDGVAHECPPGFTTPRLSWGVYGGESGPGARPNNLAWGRSFVAQFQAANVPAFVKQAGAKPFDLCPDCGGSGISLSANSSGTCPSCAGSGSIQMRLHDRKGGDMAEWPRNLRVREFPEVSTGKAGL